MTTTNYTVGIGEGDKVSSKVLKPPGGETHDIFGTGGDSHEDVNVSRRNRNYLKSNVFGADATDSSQTQDSPKQKHGGNPITGEGYMNGNSNVEAKENGQPRVRNPPGGHSSKLW